ncbi:hypothetical protein DP113_24995 [Brasilonema octagenarum UFV-E1]|uniref:Uncharacterized protein n=2 Tax=Brasilonema TaxID=383614 RepID=A0A856MK82_9CYAN|nr:MULTISPECIES: hypothetical protein [Brasilonema]NMF63031.1 hypothetical protein [Brasilonema octagenarum UFV-OR1]QDL10739.1 hypothetical protein DP114_25095 [Brasilonema sennae CENA114]QDL17083.1 hypothetical protein DP113_24995 [Brasilonema octagenarum UFV-E1]
MSSIYATRKAWMKKITRLVPLFLGLSVINVASLCLSTTQKAEALTASDWVGTWICNNDGQPPVQVRFWLHYDSVIGQIGDNSWAVIQRPYDPSIDPPTDRKDHVLPLSVQSNQTQWFLAIHTWDQRYASGFSKWNGSVYGMSCTRQ